MALKTLSTLDTDKIGIGPCYVYFGIRGTTTVLDTTASGMAALTHVGQTYGGVTVSITQNVYELKTDLYGDVPVKVMEAGVRVEVTVNMTEKTFANLQILFATANSTLVPGALTFGKPLGTTQVATGVLLLEPTDGSDIFLIYKAAANIGEAVEIAFTADNQRVYACKFVGLIDTDRNVQGDQLFRIGGYSASIGSGDETLHT